MQPGDRFGLWRRIRLDQAIEIDVVALTDVRGHEVLAQANRDDRRVWEKKYVTVIIFFTRSRFEAPTTRYNFLKCLIKKGLKRAWQPFYLYTYIAHPISSCPRERRPLGSVGGSSLGTGGSVRSLRLSGSTLMSTWKFRRNSTSSEKAEKVCSHCFQRRFFLLLPKTWTEIYANEKFSPFFILLLQGGGKKKKFFPSHSFISFHFACFVYIRRRNVEELFCVTFSPPFEDKLGKTRRGKSFHHPTY